MKIAKATSTTVNKPIGPPKRSREIFSRLPGDPRQRQPNRRDAKCGWHKANVESCQAVRVTCGLAAKEFDYPRNDCREVIECRAVIVIRIVLVAAVAHQRDQKISIHAFVVMQRHEREIVKSQKRSRDQNCDGSDAPVAR